MYYWSLSTIFLVAYLLIIFEMTYHDRFIYCVSALFEYHSLSICQNYVPLEIEFLSKRSEGYIYNRSDMMKFKCEYATPFSCQGNLLKRQLT